MDLFADRIGKAELSAQFQRQLALPRGTENKTTELFKVKNDLKWIPHAVKKLCSRKFLIKFPATLIFWVMLIATFFKVGKRFFFITKNKTNSFWKCHCSIFSESLRPPKSTFRGISKDSPTLFSLPALGEWGLDKLFTVLFHFICSCIHVSDFAHSFHDMLLNIDKKSTWGYTRAFGIISLDIKIQTPTWAADDLGCPHGCLGDELEELGSNLSNLGSRSLAYPQFVILAYYLPKAEHKNKTFVKKSVRQKPDLNSASSYIFHFSFTNIHTSRIVRRLWGIQIAKMFRDEWNTLGTTERFPDCPDCSCQSGSFFSDDTYVHTIRTQFQALAFNGQPNLKRGLPSLGLIEVFVLHH